MTGNNIVADTNIFIDLMKGNEAIAKKLESFDEVYISPVVLVELYFGAYRSANAEKHLRKIAIAIQESKLLTIDGATAEIFASPRHSYTRELLSAVPGRAWESRRASLTSNRNGQP